MNNKMPKCEGCGQELKKCLKCDQEFKEEKPNDKLDKRLLIGITLLAFSIVFFVFLLLAELKWNIVFYKQVDYENTSKIIGRILFCFNFFLLGLASRAFTFYSRAMQRGVPWLESNPWKVYVFEYLPIGAVASIFIFSVITAIQPLSSTHIFYFLSGSVSMVAGCKGYAFLDSIKSG